MNLASMWAVFGVGVLGGISVEVLHWQSLRRQGVLPQYAKSVFYWMITAAMAIIGGVVAMLYFGSNAEGILAFHIGASAPLILQKMVTSLPPTGGSRGSSPGPTIRRFFLW